MCGLIFSTTFVWNISHSTKNWTRYVKKMNTALHVKCPLLSALNKTCIFSTHFRKILKYQISWKSVHWSSAFPCGQTHRQDEAYSRFSQMSELHLQMITKRIMKPPYIIHKTYARPSTLGFKWSIPQDHETQQGSVRGVSLFTGPSK